MSAVLICYFSDVKLSALLLFLELGVDAEFCILFFSKTLLQNYELTYKISWAQLYLHR